MTYQQMKYVCKFFNKIIKKKKKIGEYVCMRIINISKLVTKCGVGNGNLLNYISPLIKRELVDSHVLTFLFLNQCLHK